MYINVVYNKYICKFIFKLKKKKEASKRKLKMTIEESNASLHWTPEMEINLFYAMIDHKPVGVNKHFNMMFVYEKFNNLNEKKLSVEQIWEHLNELYDIQALVSTNYHQSNSSH